MCDVKAAVKISAPTQVLFSTEHSLMFLLTSRHLVAILLGVSCTELHKRNTQHFLKILLPSLREGL